MKFCQAYQKISLCWKFIRSKSDKLYAFLNFNLFLKSRISKTSLLKTLPRSFESCLVRISPDISRISWKFAEVHESSVHIRRVFSERSAITVTKYLKQMNVQRKFAKYFIKFSIKNHHKFNDIKVYLDNSINILRNRAIIRKGQNIHELRRIFKKFVNNVRWYSNQATFERSG